MNKEFLINYGIALVFQFILIGFIIIGIDFFNGLSEEVKENIWILPVFLISGIPTTLLVSKFRGKNKEN